MLRVRRVGSAALVFLAALVVAAPLVALAPSDSAVAQEAPAAGSPSTTVPSTPPSVPAPPPFSMPMDSGAKLIAQRDQANLDILYYQSEVPKAQADQVDRQAKLDKVVARLTELGAQRDQTILDIDASKRRLAAAAADAYVQASGGSATVLRSMSRAEEPIDLQRDMHLMETYGEREVKVHDELVALKSELEAEIVIVTDLRATAQKKLDEAIAHVAAMQAALDDAGARLTEAEEGLTKFHELAQWASSPIMGPNYLTAADLAGFVRASGTQQNITVTIDELAQFYIEEGEKVGVRGDVAFAQSILETGYFGFRGSMVEPEDNNFAGIGACDSCKRGFRFEDARRGVRAQVQLLRTYVDKELTKDTLPDPLLLPGTLRLGFRGKVQSWWDLTGTWATAYDYGIRVYALYSTIVEWAAANPSAPAEPSPTPSG